MPVADVSVTSFFTPVTEGDTIAFAVTRTDTVGDLTVNLSVGGTATNGTDCFVIPSTIVIPNGSTSALYISSATDDSASEFTETLTVSVAPGAGYNVGGPATATVLILDNDAPVVSVAAVNDAVEGGAAGTVRLTRTGNLSGGLTVNLSVGGTATPGADYTAVGGTATFAAGSATADVTVTALHDGVIDDDETVSVTVTSGTGYSVGSPSSDAVTLIDTDILPVAFDGWVTTSVNEDAGVEVLDLATSLYGDTLTVTGVTDGDHGTVVINLDGTVTYTPDTGFVGDDAFTYTVEDPFGNAATGTVSVTVTAPVAPPTSVWTGTNTAVTVEVLELAFDPDGDTLTTTAVTQGANGTVVLNLDGTVTYTPNTSFTGDDSFTYTVEDPDGNEATHTITVTVGPTDPVALDNDVQTDTDTAVIVSLEDLAFQPAGGSVTFTVSSAAHGTVVDNLDGTVTYTPDASYTGTDSFSYTVTDASLRTDSGTITVTVGPETSAGDDALVSLQCIQDEVDNYGTGSNAIIASILSNLDDQLDGLFDTSSSLINANNIFDSGSNQPYRDFVTGRFVTFRMYAKVYQALARSEEATWNLLISNKKLIVGLWELYGNAKDANNRQLMTDRLKQINDAMVVHVELIKMHRTQREATMDFFKPALGEWLAMQKAQPSIGNLFPRPAAPPVRDVTLIRVPTP